MRDHGTYINQTKWPPMTTHPAPEPPLLQIIRTDRAGRRRYSEQSKQALVAHYLQHSNHITLAHIAQRHNITAGLLSKWVRQYTSAKVAQPSDFIALHLTPLAPALASTPTPAPSIRAHLGNGVAIELPGSTPPADLAHWLTLLHALPCSASTPA